MVWIINPPGKWRFAQDRGAAEEHLRSPETREGEMKPPEGAVLRTCHSLGAEGIIRYNAIGRIGFRERQMQKPNPNFTPPVLRGPPITGGAHIGEKVAAKPEYYRCDKLFDQQIQQETCSSKIPLRKCELNKITMSLEELACARRLRLRRVDITKTLRVWENQTSLDVLRSSIFSIGSSIFSECSLQSTVELRSLENDPMPWKRAQFSLLMF